MATSILPIPPTTGGTAAPAPYLVVRDRSELYTTLAIIAGVVVAITLVVGAFAGWFTSAKQDARLDLGAVGSFYTQVNQPSLIEGATALVAARGGQQVHFGPRVALQDINLGGSTPTGVSFNRHHGSQEWPQIAACLSGLGLTEGTDFVSAQGPDGPHAIITAAGKPKVDARGLLPAAKACNR